jgi:hypothetical protein
MAPALQVVSELDDRAAVVAELSLADLEGRAAFIAR